MTPLLFQEALVEELNTIFEHDLFKNSAGEYVKLNVYEQELPVIQSEDDQDPIPYSLVRLETGKTESGTDPQTVSVTILVGIINQDPENNGHKDVLNIIQKIYERFEKEPMLKSGYRFQDPFEWALQDEQSFPYFFGAISMTFQTPAVRKEDRLA